MAVHTIAWCPHDLSRFASAGSDKTVLIWDFEEVHPPRTLKGHNDLVTSVTWSPHDPSFLASGSQDKCVLTWDLNSFGLPKKLRGHTRAVMCVAWSPHSRTQIVSCGSDCFVLVWDLDTDGGVPIHKLGGHVDFVRSVCWSPHDQMKIVSCGDDKRIHVWNLNDSNNLKKLQRHTDFVYCVAWSKHRRDRLASGGHDCKVHVWELDSSSAVQTFEGHTNRVNAVAWCPHVETRLASCGHDKLLLIWELGNDSPVLSLEGHKSAILSLTWSLHEPNRLATCGSGRALIFWDVKAGTIIKKLEQPRPQGTLGSGCTTPNDSLSMSRTLLGSSQSPSSYVRGLSPANSYCAPDGGPEALLNEALSLDKSVTQYTHEDLKPQRLLESSKPDMHSAPIAAERNGLEDAARQASEEYETGLRAVQLEKEEAQQATLIAQQELQKAKAERDAAFEKGDASRKAEAAAAANLEMANQDIMELEKALAQANALMAERNDAAQKYVLTPPYPARQGTAPVNLLGQSVRTLQPPDSLPENQQTLFGSMQTVPVAPMIGMSTVQESGPMHPRQMVQNAQVQMPLPQGVSVSHAMQPPTSQAWVRPMAHVGGAMPMRQIVPQMSQRTSPARWRNNV